MIEIINNKLTAIFRRTKAVIVCLPKRLKRLGRHLLQFCWWKTRWYLELSYLLLDIIAIPEIYETFVDLLKWNTRPLTAAEFELLYPIFGRSIDYDRIRIDEKAFVGPPQGRFCYVSFYTINSWGPMSLATLVHEAVHVWQFEQLGSVYIPRALHAQRTPEGYNYGGAPQLANWARRDARLTDFNYEQQADIVADYWCLVHGYRTRWGPAGPADLPFYTYFVEQLQEV